MSQPKESSETIGFLSGGGDMGQLIRNYDWDATSLGSPCNWPQSLRTSIRILLTTQHPVFIFWGPDLTCFYNDAYSRSLGAERHPITLGKPARDVWEEIWHIIGPQIEQVMAGGGATWRENDLVPMTRDGKIDEVYWTYSYGPIDDELATNGVGGVLVICTETTKQVLAERSANKERERQQQLFEQMPGFVALLSGPEHVYEYANRSYREVAGHRELVGLTVRQAFPDIEGQGFYELLDTVRATGERFSTAAIPIWLNADAEPTFVDLLYEPIKDETGEVSGILVGGYDVTQATKAANALRELNETLEQRVEERSLALNDSVDFARLAFSAVGGVGVWTFDVASDSFSYDAAIVELYDIDPELGFAGIKRKDFLANVHPDDLASLRATMSGGLVTPGDLELEYRIVHSDGTIRSVLSKGHTYFGEDGKPVRRTGVGVDMTDRRALEEQLRQTHKMEAIGQLSGGLAHDFNNILAGIGGSLNMMQTRLAQGRVAELDRYVTGAQGAVKRGSALTQRMLAFSRRQTLDPQPTDMNRLVSGMTELIARSIGPQIELETVEAAGLWATFVDASQLENALLNLCINARDAMPDGGKLTVETFNKWLDDRAAKERGLPPGQYVSLSVSDTGVGMSAATIARAYDPFYTTKPVGQGTGLGLSMVHGFAGQSGGTTRIYSEVGKGTLVSIYLPRHLGDVEAEVAADVSDPPRADQKEKVLLVDDEPLLRMVALEQLEELGYSVVEAEDGPSALKLLAQHWPIDLLITDVGLPNGLNGRQLADAARELHPELKVLYITGYAENAVLNHGHLERGMQVMTKPFEMDVFATRVKAIINAD